MSSVDARELALEVLHSWQGGKRFADHVLEDAFGANALDRRDRAFTQELVYGVLRHKRELDALIDESLDRGPAGLRPALRNILRLALYQMRHLDRVPHRAAVHSAVAQVHSRRGGSRQAGFVNGLLRRIARESRQPRRPQELVTALGLEYSHPDWLVERWLQRWGQEVVEKLLRWHNRPPSVCLAPNPGRLSEGLAELMAGAGIHAESVPWLPNHVQVRGVGRLNELPGFASGGFFVQDTTAALLIRAVRRPPGPALDVCAAPGGKAIALALAGPPDSPVWALDRSWSRLMRLCANRERLGLSAIRVVAADARAIPAVGLCPLVVADVPCSGTGVVQRRVDLRWRLKPADLVQLPPLQSEILESAAQRVCAGGTLLYSTCSIEADENEEVVTAFIGRNPEFRVRRPEPAPLVERFDGTGATVMPGELGGDGGFVAVLERS